MKKTIIVIVAIIIVGVGILLLTSNKNTNMEKNLSDGTSQMVDCGTIEDPMCFLERMGSCLPTTAKLTGTEGQDITITILGNENGKCHFQRKISNTVDMNCYFPNATITSEILDQVFGNDRGLQELVDTSCGLK
ncbi:MAG TPA: hypothetical protein PKL86_01015 [Candidatus Portnoybacteria bacterium]|nr:hypothetical protein [Candidatus Portnoybacteria bacterium]